jgi:hypothetical protein
LGQNDPLMTIVSGSLIHKLNWSWNPPVAQLQHLFLQVSLEQRVARFAAKEALQLLERLQGCRTASTKEWVTMITETSSCWFLNRCGW